MKAKELKKLAQQIAKFEQIIDANQDEKVVKNAKNQVMMLSGKIQSLGDMAQLDEMIQDILKEKNS